MTRKDFERIAFGLASVRTLVEPVVFEQFVDQIALACQDCADRPSLFSYDRFANACNKIIQHDPFVPVD